VAGVAYLKVPSFHSPREGIAENIQDKNMVFRIWKASTDVSEVNYGSVYGEHFSP
jgi:hypothetical protein